MSPIDVIAKTDVSIVPGGSGTPALPESPLLSSGQDFSKRLSNSLNADPAPRSPVSKPTRSPRPLEQSGRPVNKGPKPEASSGRHRRDDDQRDTPAVPSSSTSTQTSTGNVDQSPPNSVSSNSTSTAGASPQEPVPGAPPAELVVGLMLADATTCVSQTEVPDTSNVPPGPPSPPASLIDSLIAQNGAATSTSAGIDVSHLNNATSESENQSLLNSLPVQSTSTESIAPTPVPVNPTAAVTGNDDTSKAAQNTVAPVLQQKAIGADGLAALLDAQLSPQNDVGPISTAPSDASLSLGQGSSPVELQPPSSQLASLIKPDVAVTETEPADTQPTMIDGTALYPAVPATSGIASGNSMTTVHHLRGGAEVNPVHTVRDVTSAIALVHESGGRMQLKLHPPELGALQIDVSLNNGTISARLEAQTPAAQRVLTDNLPQLQQALSQQGMNVERLEVFLADQRTGDNGPDFGDRSFQQDRQPGGESPRDQDQGYNPQERTPEERTVPPPHVTRNRQPIRGLDIKV